MDDATSDPSDASRPPDEAARSSSSAAEGPTGARSSDEQTRPWYRRGRVWAWFVLVSAVGAWVLAGVAEDRLYGFDVDPASAEARAVCEAAEPLGDVAVWGSGAVNEAANQARLDALADLAEVAPDEVAADVDEVREAEVERQAAMADAGVDTLEQREVGRAAAADLEDDHEVAIRRVSSYLDAACGDPMRIPVGVDP